MSERKLPSTSLDAYNQSAELAQAHKGQIIAALSSLGFANYEEIADWTGLDKHSVARRTSELERNQLIYKSGVQKETKSKRKAFCYCLTPTATDAPERKKRLSQEPQPRLIQQTLSIQ